MTFLGEEFSHAFNLKEDDDPLKKRKKYRKWHDFQHPLTCSLLDYISLSTTEIEICTPCVTFLSCSFILKDILNIFVKM